MSDKKAEDILKEFEEIMNSKPLVPQDDWDLIWVLSGPEDELKGETKNRLKTAFKIAKGKKAKVFYNGDDCQNDILRKASFKFCQENNFPRRKLIVSENSGIKNTKDQINKIPIKILQDKRTIVIVTDVYHLPRVKRYIKRQEKLKGKKIIFYPSDPRKAPRKKVFEEIKKILEYF